MIKKSIGIGQMKTKKGQIIKNLVPPWQCLITEFYRICKIH